MSSLHIRHDIIKMDADEDLGPRFAGSGPYPLEVSPTPVWLVAPSRDDAVLHREFTESAVSQTVAYDLL
jgi:hypothetical protein